MLTKHSPPEGRFISDIRDVPSGIEVTVFTKTARCRGCGAIAFNLSYPAIATDEYGDIGDGRIRRRFNFVGKSPLCECDDKIWLSSDDLPYVTIEWPVRESVEAIIEKDKEKC